MRIVSWAAIKVTKYRVGSTRVGVKIWTTQFLVTTLLVQLVLESLLYVI